MKLSVVLLVLTALVVALAEPRVPQRGTIHQIRAGVAGPNPYIFLTVPNGRSQSLVQGFEVIQADNDDDDAEDDEDEDEQHAFNVRHDDDSDDDDDQSAANDDNDDDVVRIQHDDDDEEEEEDMSFDVMKASTPQMKAKKVQKPLKNAKNTQMMVSRDHAGAILVPDGIIEIEGQSVIDEKTGKPALLLPRSVLDSIPDGSVVALMERVVEGRSAEEERANRVIVRRRRKGSRRNVKRSRRGNGRRRRRGGNRRRRGNKRRNVRVVKAGSNRRRNVRRGNSNIVYAG